MKKDSRAFIESGSSSDENNETFTVFKNDKDIKIY